MRALLCTACFLGTLLAVLFPAESNSVFKFDGRFYHLSFLFSREKRIDYFGLTLFELKLDARPHELLRTRMELLFPIYQEADAGIAAFSNFRTMEVNSLNAYITPGRFKITVGRFLPKWGVARVFRPLDILTPQTFFLNALSFKGVDGLSAKYYLTDFSSLELVALPSFDTNGSRIAASTKFKLASFDNNIIYMRDSQTGGNLFGLSAKGDAVVGVAAEIYYKGDSNNSILKAVFGLDYSFSKNFFVSGEYFYDESGTEKPAEYAALSSLSPRFTLAKHYLAFDFSILTYTEMNIGIGVISNLDDKSLIAYPYFRHEILPNCTVGASIYSFNGTSGDEYGPSFFGKYLYNVYFSVVF